jgi:pyruvate dehydrogenase E2 component (dihydrolipoamide acetyltransferase)
VSEVPMPRLSDSMEQGTIVRWILADGEQVNVGDELVEIETDKATMAYEAEAEGILRILAQEGATVAVGTSIGQIGDGSDPPAAAPPNVSNAASSAAGLAVPAASPTLGAPTPNGSGAGRVKASPVARRLAEALGVELAALSGSGPQGRIVKRDVETAASSSATAGSAPAKNPQGPGSDAKGTVERHPLSSTQATIARRMLESKATMPEFTVTTDVDVEAAVELRDQIRADGVERAPSLGDFVIRASALALREHPRVNGSFHNGELEIYSRVNIGIAVSAEGALFVPTLFDVDGKSLSAIAGEVRALAKRARAGLLTPAEVGGATFTVSNLGMYGVTHFTAVLNPPQAAILAVGSAEQRAVVHDGQIVARRRMTMTLSCDHRILYGADAAAFLASVRANLEHPMRLVV